MLSNSVCIKSVTFDHIIQDEEGPDSWYNFVRRKHNKTNKNVTMSLASTSLSQFLRINASLIFKLQYNRECRRGKEVENVCLFSSFNFRLKQYRVKLSSVSILLKCLEWILNWNRFKWSFKISHLVLIKQFVFIYISLTS